MGLPRTLPFTPDPPQKLGTAVPKNWAPPTLKEEVTVEIRETTTTAGGGSLASPDIHACKESSSLVSILIVCENALFGRSLFFPRCYRKPITLVMAKMRGELVARLVTGRGDHPKWPSRFSLARISGDAGRHSPRSCGWRGHAPIVPRTITRSMVVTTSGAAIAGSPGTRAAVAITSAAGMITDATAPVGNGCDRRANPSIASARDNLNRGLPSPPSAAAPRHQVEF